MITVLDFILLLKTKQFIKLTYNSKTGKTITIKGEAFRVLNSCMDINIEMCLINRIEVKENEILLLVSHEKLKNTKIYY